MSPPECYPEKALEVNALLDTLSHHVRREIIRYFENHSEAEVATLEETAEYIHDQIPGTSREVLEAQLAHNHLPKLSERGWIEYDSRTTHIRYYGHDTAARLVDEIHAIFTSG